MNIDQIIGKLMGDPSMSEEHKALDQWKSEAAENIRALEDIKKIAKATETLKGYETFDADSAWEKMQSDIRTEQTTTLPIDKNDQIPTKLFTIQNLTKIAAVLAVVFGSLFLIKNGVNVNAAEKLNTYVSADSQLDILLDDGTKIVLDKGGKIEELGERSVKLSGRAFFDVSKMMDKNFIVELETGKVTVLGTQFTIDAEGSDVSVDVSEGKVRYTLTRDIDLEAGEYIIVKDGTTTKLKQRDTNYNSWQKNRIVFSDDSFQDVIEVLNRHFKTEIIAEEASNIEKCGVTTTFQDATLDTILNEFYQTHGMRYEIREEKVYIVSSDC